MTTNQYDVLIIGGGFVGLAIAYHLARQRANVLLLEANTLGSGTSGSSAGRAQVSESHRGLHLELVLAGLARLEGLEEELGAEFEWRRLGNLMLIESDRHWQWWSDQVAYLRDQGVPAAMLDPTELAEAEPLLRAERFRGAAWCLEGHLNPFKLCTAYAEAARRAGGELRQGAPVIALERKGERIVAVHTRRERLTAGTVVVAAGAWTGELLRLAGVTLPVRFTHAEAIITEPLPPVLHHHIGLADFYETIHSAPKAVSIGVAQQQNGTLLVTEAVEMTPILHRANSAWGLPSIARDLLSLFPALAGVRIMRAWAAPSPFLPDEQPAIGWLPGLDNTFVAACLHLTITTIPVLSDLIAGMILGEGVEYGAMQGDLSAAQYSATFSPARFLS